MIRTAAFDSLVDLDVLVAIERSDLKPQPSVCAKTVRRALEARRKVSDRVACCRPARGGRSSCSGRIAIMATLKPNCLAIAVLAHRRRCSP